MMLLTRQNMSDLVDAVAVAVEDLRYRAELTDDYTIDDVEDMVAKADRLDALFPTLTKHHQLLIEEEMAG